MTILFLVGTFEPAC